MLSNVNFKLDSLKFFSDSVSWFCTIFTWHLCRAVNRFHYCLRAQLRRSVCTRWKCQIAMRFTLPGPCIAIFLSVVLSSSALTMFWIFSEIRCKYSSLFLHRSVGGTVTCAFYECSHAIVIIALSLSQSPTFSRSLYETLSAVTTTTNTNSRVCHECMRAASKNYPLTLFAFACPLPRRAPSRRAPVALVHLR